MDEQHAIVPPQLGHMIDVGAGATVLAALVGLAPTGAAVLGAIWYLCQLFSFFRKEFCRKAKRRRTDVQS